MNSVINTVKLSIYTGEKTLLKITGNILDSEVVSHRRRMEEEAKANSRRCFMGENCCAHGFFKTM